MTRHDLDRLKRLNESKESVDSRLSLDEVEARMSIDGSWTDELFGTPEIRKALESENVMNVQGDAHDVLTMKEAYGDSAEDKEGNELAAAESGDDIVEEKIPPSPMKNRTRSKSRTVIVPEAPMCSDSEDELLCPLPSKRHPASPARL